MEETKFNIAMSMLGEMGSLLLAVHDVLCHPRQDKFDVVVYDADKLDVVFQRLDDFVYDNLEQVAPSTKEEGTS